MKILRSQSGQTLIEVIVAIGLVVLVLITLVSSLTLSIRNNQFAKDQVLALNRSREALEWFRSLRDQMGWDAFTTMITADGSPVTYCLSSLPTTVAQATSLTNQSCLATDVISGTKYVRSLLVTLRSTTEVDATVSVSWVDGSKAHQSQSTLILQKSL